MSIEHAYDQVADAYADHFPSTEPEQAIELAMIEHFASSLPADRREVLDAGCGAGRMLPVLARLGCQPTGVDLSFGMVARAQRDHPSFPVSVASISDLPFPDCSFDGTFYWYSTIHTPDSDLPLVFAEAQRVLRPGGLVLVAFQAGEGAREVGEGFRKLGYDVTMTRHHRTADQIADFLGDAGFTETARLIRGPVGSEKDDQAALIARLSPP